MMDYRHQAFIFDMRDKLDELSYGAHNLAGACFDRKEEEFFETLSRRLASFGDNEMERYHLISELGKYERNGVRR